ncbi:hypothetical protein [Halovivax limisalsi]|uniref:hypothetical protein n=1 Tax=Halovivax limisalsi TaxID=1453760 RepID=UPI001FFD45D6|nr:hypothetical protein [Halovivax limisalsi]
MSTPTQSAADPLEQLQNKWYNALTTGLELDEQSFQIVEASEPIEATADLWATADGIPPESTTQVFTQSGYDSFYDLYRNRLLYSLKPDETDWTEYVTEDDVKSWKQYQQKHRHAYFKDPVTTFERWATLNLVGSTQTNAVEAFRQTMQTSPIMTALQSLRNPHYYENGDADSGTPKYSDTYDEIRSKLADGSSYSFTFDSEEQSGSTKDCWSSSGKDILGLIVDRHSEHHLSKTFSESRVQANASFDSVVTVPITAGGWYNAAALELALKHEESVWRTGDGYATWDELFGDDGAMQRLVTDLVVTAGVDVTITSDASYSAEQQSEIKDYEKKGLWPFYRTSSSDRVKTSTSFDAQGHMEVHFQSPSDVPLLLGVNVQSVESLFD